MGWHRQMRILWLCTGMDASSRQSHSCGVAVVLGQRASAAWRAAGAVFNPVSDRLLRVRLKLHTGFVSIIAVYAPTNEPTNQGESMEFYQVLQEVTRQVPVRDMVLVMGDFNAQVGNDVETWCGTLGRFGPHEQNENGVWLLGFCALNSLVAINTCYQHLFPAPSLSPTHMVSPG